MMVFLGIGTVGLVALLVYMLWGAIDGITGMDDDEGENDGH